MSLVVILPAITSILALLFAVALIDQWRERRRRYQIVWAIGMINFGIASACEALAGAGGWNETLYRTWYLTGAVLTAGWLGLGTAYLLAKTRFGYAYAVCLALSGIFTVLTQAKYHYPDAGITPAIYLVGGLVLAVAVGIETYFQNDNWPRIAGIGVIIATHIGAVIMINASLPAPGFAVDPRTNIPTGEILPGSVRLLTPFMNITGGIALVLGALFSAYMFMPKRRVLAYSLDPVQSGDVFLFNLLIAPVAIVVNFLASLPGTLRALVQGRLHSRVPATILIAVGALVASSTDSLNRFGSTELFQAGKLVAVVLLLAGFLVSIEVFRDIRVPFTSLRLSGTRAEREPAADPGSGSALSAEVAGSAGEGKPG
ncbi:MAG: hypothetical protein E6I45_12015 [Chloroflexi bacterium]|nr:MAG: hypothetical protein E6I45_12015 [Chloroflexota bacterium]